jgi:mRNA-degrading endonuclease RelE of RelBE toxin-antitoxin system
LIKYSKKAIEDLAKIQNPFNKQIVKKIEAFQSERDSNVTFIQGSFNSYRIKSGNYRIIILKLNDGNFEIESIGIRRTVFGGH